MNLTARLVTLPARGDRHRHAHHQLVVGCQGEARFEIGGSKGRISALRGCLAPADTEHFFQGRGHNLMVVIDLEAHGSPVAGVSLKERGLFDGLFEKPRFFDVDPSLQQLLRFGAQELTRQPQGPIQRHLGATLLHALHTRLGDVTEEREAPRGLDLNLVEKHMHERLHTRITVPQLAALVHISPSHFHTLFKHHTGCSPHQYLLRLRLDTAMELVRDTNLSLVEISHRTGFSSQSALSHALRKHRQVTPSQLRGAARNPR